MRHRLSTTQVTRLLHVSVASAASWVDQDQLVTGRTPGGHRRIEVDNLVRFLRHQKLRVPPVFVNRNPKVPVADDGLAAGDVVATFEPNVVILDFQLRSRCDVSRSM